jgi:hypothetical protein
MIHNYIFFRAPYYSDPIDYTSIDTEIESSFGEGTSATPSLVWIRIDPERSFVYSSEIRAKFIPGDNPGMFTHITSPHLAHGSPKYQLAMEMAVLRSRKSMNEYLRILDENKKAINEIPSDKRPVYNLITSKVQFVPQHRISYPFTERNINRMSEVLVRVPHLTPDYFVKCSEEKKSEDATDTTGVRPTGISKWHLLSPRRKKRPVIIYYDPLPTQAGLKNTAV